MTPALKSALSFAASQIRAMLEGVGETTPARLFREAGEYARASGLSQGDAYEILRRVYAGTKQDPTRALATTLLVSAKEALPLIEGDVESLVKRASTPRLTERLCSCPITSSIVIHADGRCGVCGLKKYDPNK